MTIKIIISFNIKKLLILIALVSSTLYLRALSSIKKVKSSPAWWPTTVAAGAYPGFCNMKRLLEVLQLLPSILSDSPNSSLLTICTPG